MARGNYTSKVAANVANFTSKINQSEPVADTNHQKPKKETSISKEPENTEKPKDFQLLNDRPTSSPIKDSFDYKASNHASPLKSVTVRLTEKNSDFLFTRSLQLGMTKQDYFSLLLEERKALNLAPVSPSRSQGAKYKDASKTHTIRIPEDLITFSKMDAARNIMKITEYFNYVVDCEQQREDKNGLRKGRYDV